MRPVQHLFWSFAPRVRRKNSSLVERLLTGGCDSDADNFGWHGARLRSLAFCNRKPGANEVGDHLAIEAMGTHEQGLSSTTRANGKHLEQLQRAAGMRADTAFSNGRHKFSIDRKLFTFN
jgi:hypothetical protein